MKYIIRIINWLSSLKVAIVILLLIALASGIGTSLPQNAPLSDYLTKYESNKFLGLFNGQLIINLQLNHVYSSLWFLFLLTWLSISLIICSWKRQLPSLRKAMKWIDYKDPKQIQKLAISQTFQPDDLSECITKLETYLTNHGWKVQNNKSRLSARKGVIGKVGPPLVHLGLIILMIGSTFGSLKGENIERFLAPGRSIDLINPNGLNLISLKLNNFTIDRSPNGQPEQFRSKLLINDKNLNEIIKKEISVNHPFRYRGMTIYQADWSLAAITIKINNSPKLQLPLQKIDQLGEQVWGVLVPKLDDKNEQFLLTLSSEQGPVRAFNSEGELIGLTRPGGANLIIGDSKVTIFSVLPSSGILLKHDPGVPIVYIGFLLTMIGSILSIISTNQIWVISEDKNNTIYIGGLSNRNSMGFAIELPNIINESFLS